MRRGFTLIELLVVLGILAVVASAMLINGSSVRRRGQQVQASTHGATVTQALSRYLTTYITVTPQELMNLPGVQALPAPNPPPPDAPALTAARSCETAATLPDPNGNPSPFGWGDAPPGVGCSFGYVDDGGLSRTVVITWVKGSSAYYVNGRTP